MTALIPSTEEAALLAQEEQIRREEKASDAFFEALWRDAEEIRKAHVTEWETCPMI